MQGFVRANHWGISASHSSTLKKLDEMGDNFDDKVKTWKSELEKNHLISEMLGIVDEYVKAQDKEQIPEGFQTTDVSSLSLTFPESPADVPNTEYSEHESQSTNSDLPSMEDFLDDYVDYCENFKDSHVAENDPVSDHLLHKCGFSQNDHQIFKDFVVNQLEGVEKLNTVDKVDISVLKSRQEDTMPTKYQIIGDNVDMYVKTKHMSSDKQNKSIHWFAMNAIQERVSLKCTSTEQIKSILDVENSEFLPSAEDNSKLLQDFIPLASRVLVNKVPDLQCLKGAVMKHIPHQYSQLMKKKSVQVSGFVKHLKYDMYFLACALFIAPLQEVMSAGQTALFDLMAIKVHAYCSVQTHDITYYTLLKIMKVHSCCILNTVHIKSTDGQFNHGF